MPPTRQDSKKASAQRAALAARIYRTAKDHTESFEVDIMLTSSVLYLIGAVLCGTCIGLVGPRYADVLAMFRRWFPADDAVWDYVVTETDRGNK